jgi:hypothetical protein
LSKCSCCSGVSETMFTSLMRTAGVALRRSYAYRQLESLLCCPMMMAEHPGLSSHIHAGPSETTIAFSRASSDTASTLDVISRRADRRR